jgi:hypothetical protein
MQFTRRSPSLIWDWIATRSPTRNNGVGEGEEQAVRPRSSLQVMKAVGLRENWNRRPLRLLKSRISYDRGGLMLQQATCLAHKRQFLADFLIKTKPKIIIYT